MYTWSKYNTLFKREGVYLFYNSLSNAFVELSEKMYDFLCAFKPGDVVSGDDDLLTMLQSIKAIADDEHEIRKVKFINNSRRHQENTLVLTINPTLACNFACPYCFESSHPNSHMTDEVAGQIIDYIKNRNPKAISVTWFGGEPLLEFQRIKSLTKDMTGLVDRYRASMITNGYLLTEEIAAQLSELQIKHVQITLDGPAETHNKRRFLKSGGPTFDRIYNNVIKAAPLAPDVDFCIRVNIDSENADSFIELCKMFDGKEKNIKVAPAFVSDVMSDGHLQCVMNRTEQFHFMRNTFRVHGRTFGSFYPSNIRQECAVRCPSSIVIGPEGELYKCWNDVAIPEKVYGHITGKITNENILYEYLLSADPFDDDTCKKCVLLPVCAGGCPHTRMIDLKKGTRNACPINQSLLEDYLWEHYLIKQTTKQPETT